MTEVGISLGWRCETATEAVRLKLRQIKKQQYNTCPFDLCVTHYDGIIKCLKDDFKHFCDPKYLILRDEPKMIKHFGNSQTENQKWIYNTYYDFAFNHESPGHANLYINEEWPNGKNHFCENNFKKFIERYDNRINNFRNYIKSGNKINFIIHKYNYIPIELKEELKIIYPTLQFTLYNFINYSTSFKTMLLGNTTDDVKNFDIDYLKYLNVTNDKMYDCYHNTIIKPEIYTDIKILYFK